MKNPFSIQTIINDKLATPREERKPTSWNASKLGTCLTGVYLERLGIPPDEEFDARTLRVFSAGKTFEQWIIEMAKTPDVKFEEQVRIELPEYDVTGYADLVCEINGEKIIYEIKSKNSRAFWYMEKQKEGANFHHKMQAWLYMKALNIPEARILYVSKDDLCLLEYPIKLDDQELAETTLNELRVLNEAWKQQLPPPVPKWEKKDQWKASYCRWHKQCVSQQKYLII